MAIIDPVINTSMCNISSLPNIGEYYIDPCGVTRIWDGYSWVNTTQYMIYNSNRMSNNAWSPINDLSVAVTLDSIKNLLGLIEPDQLLIEKYPAVKAAWEDYQNEFNNALGKMFPDLKAAIDSYKTVLSLVKIEESNSDNI